MTVSVEHVLSDYRPIVPRLVHVALPMLREAWPHIEPHLIKACDESRGEFTPARILANLEHWDILAIIRGDAVQAVMVTCISQAGERRTLDCLLASGDNAKEWPLVDEQFDAFALAHGCTSVRIPCARKGWAKALPHWKIRGYVMEREI